MSAMSTPKQTKLDLHTMTRDGAAKYLASHTNGEYTPQDLLVDRDDVRAALMLILRDHGRCTCEVSVRCRRASDRLLEDGPT